MNKYIVELTVRHRGFWNGMKCFFGRDNRFSEFTITGDGSLDELHDELREKILEIKEKKE